jgi:hypothetical protein
MEAHASMMKAMNEASNIALSKMMQEAKILTVDMSNMDLLERAWHEMYRQRIGKEVMAAQAATASTAMLASATPPVIDAQPPPSRMS